MDLVKKRLLYELIINQLIFDGYSSIANELAEVAMVPHSESHEDGDKLWKLVQSLQKDKIKAPDPNENRMDGDELTTDLALKPQKNLDFDTESIRYNALNYTTKFITTHKNACRVAKFSPDGKFVATGSEDTSIKLLDTEKMKTYNQTKGEHGEDYTASRPVIRTFYDHTQGVNDLDFHPVAPILASSSKDCTIRFYDFGQSSMKRSFRVFQDSHNVRSIHFHPSGDFLLAGTDHNLIHLWNISTSKCYTVAPNQESQHLSPINQVRYSSEGNIYASGSKDGTIKLWDTVTNKVINTIPKPHSGFEVTTIQFSRNQRYLLSAGKDSVIRVWELSTGRQIQQIVTGGVPLKNRISITFSYNEDFVVSSDESTFNALIWNVRTGELAQRLSGHTNVIKCIAASPNESALMTCSTDYRARFWLQQEDEQQQQQ